MSLVHSPLDLSVEEEHELIKELMSINATDYLLGRYDKEIHGSVMLKMDQIRDNSYGKYGRLSNGVLKSIKPRYIADIKNVGKHYKVNISFDCNCMLPTNDNKLFIWWDSFDDTVDDDVFVVDYYSRNNVSFNTWINYSEKEIKKMLSKI